MLKRLKSVVGWVRRYGGYGGGVVLLLLWGGRQLEVAVQSRLSEPYGPLVQQSGAESLVLVWRSAEAEIGWVSYGLAADQLQQVQLEAAPTRQHRVMLSGLQPATRYYYRVGESPIYSIKTAPLTGSGEPIRFWVQGDPGHYNDHTAAVNQAAWSWMERHPLADGRDFDLWLTTGDNAYNSGKFSEFQRHLLQPYAARLPLHGYWPLYGNHDARRDAFYRLFDFPTRGELGGVASGSEHFFSLNYGMVHLIQIDSEGLWGGDTVGLKAWLKRDLQANQQRWTVVMLHHPPYSKGSHNADRLYDSRGRMALVRHHLVPILERFGVDLVISGHSHVYERTHLMAGFYGVSDAFNPDRDQPDRRSPYLKSDRRGTLYLVVGASYDSATAPLNHPAMAVATRERGSLVLDLEQKVLVGRYMDSRGAVLDQFELEKSLP